MKKTKSIYFKMCRKYNPKKIPEIQIVVDKLYCNVSALLGKKGKTVYMESSKEKIKKYYIKNFNLLDNSASKINKVESE